MLKIKSFLLALCLSPLSLTAFQLPVSAGGVSNAGSASGVINGSTGSFSAPITTIVTPAQVQQAITTSISLITTGGRNFSPLNSSSLVSLLNLAPSAAVGNVTLITTPASAGSGSTTTATSSVNGALGTVIAPTTGSQGSVTINGVQVAIPAASSSQRAPLVTQAAIAVLLAGGTAQQAATAASIVNSGGAVSPVIALISQLSFILGIGNISADPLVPNLNASLLKSFDSGKELLLAQSKGGSVNPAAIAAAINTYNEILDTSSPSVVAELSKNEKFIEIGQALRKLRAAFND